MLFSILESYFDDIACFQNSFFLTRVLFYFCCFHDNFRIQLVISVKRNWRGHFMKSSSISSNWSGAFYRISFSVSFTVCPYGMTLRLLCESYSTGNNNNYRHDQKDDKMSLGSYLRVKVNYSYCCSVLTEEQLERNWNLLLVVANFVNLRDAIYKKRVILWSRWHSEYRHLPKFIYFESISRDVHCSS